MHLGVGTFNTADEAARAYDAAAWRLNRPRRDMNFLEVMTREWAQRLAPPRGLSPKRTIAGTEGRSAPLDITGMDEHTMMEWRQQFLHDVLDERAFFA
ncbi:hypothetical protein D1007_60403 [Hordeum vulgare]|nr:hypothetical protein D1007_60403 [Hordeum vulgare]